MVARCRDVERERQRGRRQRLPVATFVARRQQVVACEDPGHSAEIRAEDASAASLVRPDLRRSVGRNDHDRTCHQRDKGFTAERNIGNLPGCKGLCPNRTGPGDGFLGSPRTPSCTSRDRNLAHGGRRTDDLPLSRRQLKKDQICLLSSKDSLTRSCDRRAEAFVDPYASCGSAACDTQEVPAACYPDIRVVCRQASRQEGR